MTEQHQDLKAQAKQALKEFSDTTHTPTTTAYNLVAVGTGNTSISERTWRRLANHQRHDFDQLPKHTGAVRAMCIATDLAKPSKQFVKDVQQAIHRRTPEGENTTRLIQELLNGGGEPDRPRLDRLRRLPPEMEERHTDEQARARIADDLAAALISQHPTDWGSAGERIIQTAVDLTQLGQHLAMLGLANRQTTYVQEGLHILQATTEALRASMTDDSSLPKAPTAPTTDTVETVRTRMAYIEETLERFTTIRPHTVSSKRFLAGAVAARDTNWFTNQTRLAIARIDPDKTISAAPLLREVSDHMGQHEYRGLGHRAEEALSESRRRRATEVYEHIRAVQHGLLCLAIAHCEEPPDYTLRAKEIRDRITTEIRALMQEGATHWEIAQALRATGKRQVAYKATAAAFNSQNEELIAEITKQAARALEQAAKAAEQNDGNVYDDIFGYDQNRTNYHIDQASRLMALSDQDIVDRACREAPQHPLYHIVRKYAPTQ